VLQAVVWRASRLDEVAPDPATATAEPIAFVLGELARPDRGDQSLAERRSKVVGGAVVSGADGGNEAGDSGGLFDVPRLWIVETLARDEQQERQAARQRERSA
jgi:hypothetical protein